MINKRFIIDCLLYKIVLKSHLVSSFDFFLSSSNAAPIISPILAPEEDEPYSFRASFSS